MEFLSELWVPILVSAVFVFIASSIIHMATPMHKGDFKKLKNEDAVMDALRANGVEPDTYMFPNCASMKDMGSPEMVEKFKRGPVGWMTVLPAGGYNMGKSLAQWFLFILVVNMFVAYVAWHALHGRDVPYLEVFRMAGTTAILAHAAAQCHDSIWKGRCWGVTSKFIIDGIIYGLLTAGTFGWLWHPHAG